MNSEIFAQWFQRQGLHVLQTQSSYWVNFGPGVYQAFPYHALIKPSRREFDDLFKRGKVLSLRYSTHPKENGRPAGYHAVYDCKQYDISQLDHRTRNNIRRGLKKCQVTPISFARLAEEGSFLIKDTLVRQKRQANAREENWHQLCSSSGDLPGFEAWGALVRDKLAALMLTFQMGDWCYMLYQYSLSEFLPDRANHALTYTVTKTIIERPNVAAILYSLQSLDAASSVDDFKFRMGYTAKPVSQEIAFHPWLQTIAKSSTASMAVDFLQRCLPGNNVLAKAGGMLRSYREQQNQ